MEILKSRHYKRSRIKNKVRETLKKIFQLGLLVIIGEYMLMHVINSSLNSLSQHEPFFDVRNVPRQIVNFATGEKPILRVARTYEALVNKKVDFDQIIQRQYPIHVRGNRPEFRTTDLQDQEGAKIGYVLKF